MFSPVIFEKNLSLLETFQPRVNLSAVKNSSFHPFKMWSDGKISGLTQAFPGGRVKYLTSRKNPTREVERVISSHGLQKGHPCILLGCGTGMILRPLLNFIGPDCRVVVAEPHLPLFKIFLGLEIAKKYITDSRIIFVVDPDCKIFLKKIEGVVLDDEEFKNASMILYSNMLEGLPDGWTFFQEWIETYRVEKRSHSKFSPLLERNLEGNTRRIDMAIPTRFILDKDRVKNLMVVGGGPSLDLELNPDFFFAREFFILSSGTGARPLLDKGITPDAVMITDPQKETIQQLQGLPAGIAAIFLPTSFHILTAAVPGAFTFCLIQNDPLPDSWDAKKKFFLEIETGGSVVTSAISAAVNSGAKRVCLLGCDFSFPRRRKHASGSWHTQTLLSNLDKFSNHEKNLFEEPGEEIVYVTSTRGELVPTQKNLQIYLRWVERYIKKHPGVTFYRIGDEAAHVTGARSISLKDWADITRRQSSAR